MFVPSGSLASTTGRTFVIRVRSGLAEWVDVKTGLTSGELVEVFGDLQPGDDVAVRGSDEIHAGDHVQIKPVKTAEIQWPLDWLAWASGGLTAA